MPKKGDPRPKERFKWMEPFRKVKGVPFNGRPATKTVNGGDKRTVPVSSGLEPYTGPWTTTQAAHLIRRTMFGVTPTDLKNISSLSMDQAVDQMLTASVKPSPPVNNYDGVDPGITDPHINPGETWVLGATGGTLEPYRIVSLKGWVNRNMILQEPNIHEKMKLFWSNLTPVRWWDVFVGKMGYVYYQTLHDNALGNFRTLIKAITLDPCMLVFLNGQANNKDAPDENYGRELQELFCIGKGPDSHYTEDDVKAAARVLTGWQINWDAYSSPGAFFAHLEPAAHDTTDKQFSSFYGNKIITGRTGTDGALELDDLLDMIVGTEECSKYICRRIYTFFVFSEIDAATEQNVITPLAAILRNNQYEILPVLSALFRSAHFYDVANVGAMIKNPVDHTIGLLRTLGVDMLAGAGLNTFYLLHQAIHWHMAAQGLEVGDPPNVAGWPAYYEAPSYDKIWISTDTITKRASTTDSLSAYGFYYSGNHFLLADLPGFVEQLDHPEDPNLLIRDASNLLFGMPLSDSEITNIKSLLLSGQTTDGYWTSAWLAYVNDKTNVVNEQIVKARLQTLFRSMLQLGEYHLM